MKTGILFKKGNKEAEKFCREISKYLQVKGHKVVEKDGLKGADYILTIGGDGTLIHNACEYAELGIPFVGLNAGRLGFLTAADGEDWKKTVDKLILGDVVISERITIGAKIGGEKYRAINELVIKGIYRVVDINIDVAGKGLMKITGDGVIVASQTGSTAYSLSSGGPIVDPDLDCFLITPINPIGLPVPSVVVSPEDEINLTLEAGTDVSLILDGQEHTKISKGDCIEVSKGKYKVKFGYFDKDHFIHALNAKFALSKRFGV